MKKYPSPKLAARKYFSTLRTALKTEQCENSQYFGNA